MCVNKGQVPMADSAWLLWFTNVDISSESDSGQSCENVSMVCRWESLDSLSYPYGRSLFGGHSGHCVCLKGEIDNSLLIIRPEACESLVCQVHRD